MKTSIPARFQRLVRLGIFSPGGLAARALFVMLVYSLCELAGLREYATFLSGTQHGGQWSSSVFLGVGYLFAYYGCVLGSPILLLAAGILRLRGRRALAVAFDGHKKAATPGA